MMQRLLERGLALAADARARTIERIAGQLRDQVRGTSVEIASGSIVLRGRHLLSRWISDPALRFASWRRG